MKTYTLKQVIFGLREAYKENEKELKRLKTYVHPKDESKIKEYDFYTYYEGKDKYLQLELKAQQSFIVNLLEKISGKIVYDDNNQRYEIAKNMKGASDYLLIPRSDLYTVDLEQLLKESQGILENEFMKNISSEEIFNTEESVSFRTSPLGIKLAANDSTTKFESCMMYYDASRDRLSLFPDYNVLDPEQLLNIFNTQINQQQLSDYQKKIIDNSIDNKKSLYIDKMILNKNTQRFDVTDTDEQIQLLRTKR